MLLKSQSCFGVMHTGMFKDKAFQVRSAVDKRGRKIGKAKNREDMRKYYRIADEQVSAHLLSVISGRTSLLMLCHFPYLTLESFGRIQKLRRLQRMAKV